MSVNDFNDDAPCAACDELVYSNDDALECDICEKWFHLPCADASQSLYDMYDQCNSLPWICKSCKSSIRHSFTVVKQLISDNLALRDQVSELIKVVEDLKLVSSSSLPPHTVKSLPESQHAGENSSTPSRPLSPQAELDNDIHLDLPADPLTAASQSHSSSSQRPRSTTPPQQPRQSNKSNHSASKRPEIRYLRKVDKDCSISSI